MNARVALGVAVAEYKEWRRRGGQRGTEGDTRRRVEISNLVHRAREEVSFEETITLDVEGRHEIDPFEEAA